VRTPSRRVAAAALAGLALTALTACGGSGGAPASGPTPVPGAAQNGRMTIGIPFDEPGLGVKDGDTYSGFDVETAKYVAKAVGVPEANITWVEANGADREQLLESGGADMIVSTFTINDERKQKVDFAGPYFQAHQDLLVRTSAPSVARPRCRTSWRATGTA
jgi:glutamate transport system substrate-binding protein